MDFMKVPPEIHCAIAGHLKLADLSALMRTTHYMAELLAPELDREAVGREIESVGSVLHWAAEEGQVNLAKRLLNKGFCVSDINHIGHTPLHSAAKAGQAEITQFFLGCGADLEAGAHDFATPLLEAAQNGRPPVVRILLEAGADYSVENHRGCHYTPTPLQAAIGGMHPLPPSRPRGDLDDVVRLLLDAGADFLEGRGVGKPPLSLAVRAG